MIHGRINEQGHCLDVSDDISGGGGGGEYINMISSKSLVSGVFILEIIFIADYQAMHLCHRCYKSTFFNIS